VKLLVAIKSCKKDRDAGGHDSIRKTWGRDLAAAGIDLRFFVGTASTPLAQREENTWMRKN